MQRLLRAAVRPLKRLIRSIHLAHIGYMQKHSAHELERLYDMRDDLVQLERNEHRFQARLEERRNRVLRGVL